MASARDLKNETTDGGKAIGVGIGLRSPHYADFLQADRDSLRPIRWLEAISENYMGLGDSVELSGGRALEILEKIRRDFPIVLHGVSMSIGSVDELNVSYLNKLKLLIERIEPSWVSDHICWTGALGENLHDLLPLPLTGETLDWVSERIDRVQSILNRPLVLENVSSYLTFRHSEMSEPTFLVALARKTGCRLLVDINNVYVNSVNHGFNPSGFLREIPSELIAQLHLAGHSLGNPVRGEKPLLIDTHDGPVSDEVWRLFREAVDLWGKLPTLIEWDDHIPELDRLRAEARRAHELMEASRVRVQTELT